MTARGFKSVAEKLGTTLESATIKRRRDSSVVLFEEGHLERSGA